MSGIAIQTEFTLLNARLSSIADNLELAEENIWEIIYAYMGYDWDGKITYPDNFALHNTDNELDQYAKIKALSSRPEVQAEIDLRIAEMLDIESVEAQDPESDDMNHPVTTEDNRGSHIQEMIMEGYEDDEILDIHPEITQADITAAKQQLLNLNG
jgi:hypothetical protein